MQLHGVFEHTECHSVLDDDGGGGGGAGAAGAAAARETCSTTCACAKQAPCCVEPSNSPHEGPTPRLACAVKPPWRWCLVFSTLLWLLLETSFWWSEWAMAGLPLHKRRDEIRGCQQLE